MTDINTHVEKHGWWGHGSDDLRQADLLILDCRVRLMLACLPHVHQRHL